MSVFSIAACLLNQHEPVRREVIWDGRFYSGHCRHCGKPIQRHGRRNWRRKREEATDTETA